MTVKLEKHFKNIQSTIYNSFEELETSNTVNISKDSFKGIFIRAPKISSFKKNVEVLSSIGNSPVMIKQDKILATTFHPELADDTRIHKYFVEMVANVRKN